MNFQNDYKQERVKCNPTFSKRAKTLLWESISQNFSDINTFYAIIDRAAYSN